MNDQVSFAAPRGLKEGLRERLRARRFARSATRGEAFARHALDACRGCATVALYASTGHEPDAWPTIEALHAAGVRVLLPVLAGRRHPDWAEYTGRRQLRPGWQGILEPTTAPFGPSGLAQADWIWCSALAATPDGRRLGTGGGWYDRALEHARDGVPVGVFCFDDEVLEDVPTEAWDRPVGWIATEVRLLKTSEG